VPLVGVIVAVAVTVGVVYGTTRFRTPAEVPIVLLATVGFDEAIGLGLAKWRGARAPATPDAAVAPAPDGP